jgi:putative ABC transport system permease protein
MSLWSRFANVFRGGQLNRDIDEELEAHVEEAVSEGRDPGEARRALGSTLRYREASRDVRLLGWLESLRADAVFGWRQLKKSKVSSSAAILSLALGIGACTAAFRLIDALLLRPLPVANAEQLYVIAFEGTGPNGTMIYDSCSYPMFRQMRADVKEQAELIGVSYADRLDLTYGSDQAMEKEYVQFVSGWMFSAFGIRPAAGRLFSDEDDNKPGAHPYAVLSYDYWARRFGRDPGVVGKTFRIGETEYQIIGVAEKQFTGTETGTMTGIFLPMAMKNPQTLASWNNFWMRTFIQLRPGVAVAPVAERLRSTFFAIREERVKTLVNLTPQQKELFFKEKLLVNSAAAGRSNLQRDYKEPLETLGALVGLLLLIVCANVANLMTAQAAARSREMALRVSIGAGRWRLVQMVLVESALRALLAAIVGGVFAWWAAPFVVAMIRPPDDPARLALPEDWRVFGFVAVLSLGVAVLFGLAPALRASAVKPASALKGGENPHFRGRLMHTLIAAQVAICFLVLFTACLFVTTFEKLTRVPTGFSADRVLNLETLTHQPQLPALWDQVAEHLREVPGVESVAMTTWPMMSGESWVGEISIDGAPPGDVLSDLLAVSPGWIEEMRIPFLDGRGFRRGESYPNVAIVNESFANQFCHGENPVGKTFEEVDSHERRLRFEIVGYVKDARSRDNPRLPIRPTAYVPFDAVDAAGAPQLRGRGTFVVRTHAANPLTLASMLRQEVARARPEFYVSNIRTQAEINRGRTFRERLLATLALFFAVVALLLAGVGLYGVLHYSVLQRRREIGIRIAIGAQAGGVARLVTTEVFAMVFLGAVAGVGLGMLSARYIATLFYQVRATDAPMLAYPSLALLAVALLAAVPAVVRAVRIDPALMLRVE